LFVRPIAGCLCFGRLGIHQPCTDDSVGLTGESLTTMV